MISHSFNKTRAPGPSLPAPHTSALLTPFHLTHTPLTQGTQAQRPLVTSLNPKLSPGSALAAPSAWKAVCLGVSVNATYSEAFPGHPS